MFDTSPVAIRLSITGKTNISASSHGRNNSRSGREIREGDEKIILVRCPNKAMPLENHPNDNRLCPINQRCNNAI